MQSTCVLVELDDTDRQHSLVAALETRNLRHAPTAKAAAPAKVCIFVCDRIDVTSAARVSEQYELCVLLANPTEPIDPFPAADFVLPRDMPDTWIARALATAASRLHRRTGPERDHYLKRELYELVQRDAGIFEFLQAGSLDGIWYWDLEKQQNEWMSPRFWQILGIDPQTRRHDPAEWQDLIHPDDLQTALANFAAHVADPDHPYDQIVRYLHSDGSTVWVRCRGIAIRDGEGRAVRMLGAHNEITQIKASEIALQEMLREMNHRISNNLAILEAIIRIEQWNPERPISDVLSDIIARVEAIRLIHVQLQKQPGDTSVDLKGYIEALVAAFLDASNLAGHETSVAVRATAGRIAGETAQNLGLITNELMTNSAKYARMDNVEVLLQIDGDELHYTYSDNTPQPAGAAEKLVPGTGLTLVETIAKGLNGKFSVAHEDGRIVFRIEAVLNREGSAGAPAQAPT